MLEGKELEGKLGDAGTYSVDIDAALKCIVTVSIAKEINGLKATSANSIEMDLATLLRDAKTKVDNPVFSGAVETILKVLGR